MDFKGWIEQKATKVFIILVIIQVLYLLALFIADAIVNIEQKDEIDSDSSLDDYYKWTILFLFQISDCYYVFNAIYKCNVLELFAFITIEFITFLCTFARFYNLIEYTNKQTNLITLAVFDYLYLIYSFCILVLSIVCYKAFYDVFFYKNIMKVGASKDRQNMFTNYSNFSAFMKLFFLISLSTFVTFFYFFDTGYWYLYFIDSIIIILILISIIIGTLALKQENIMYFWLYLALIIVIQLYILTKTTYYIIYKYQQENLIVSDQADTYTVMIVIGTTISCLTIMLFDIFYAFQCKYSFGNGLKEALESQITEPGQELGESSYSQK